MTYHLKVLTEFVSAQAQFYLRAQHCDIPRFIAGAILQLEIEKAKASPQNTIFDAIERASRKLVK